MKEDSNRKLIDSEDQEEDIEDKNNDSDAVESSDENLESNEDTESDETTDDVDSDDSEKIVKPKKPRSKPREPKAIVCKKCGTVVNLKENPPSKTWNMMSPMPDKDGNVTLTIMGSLRCANPECRASIIAALQKIKGDDVNAAQKFNKNEYLLATLSQCHEKTPISVIAQKIGLSELKVEKATAVLISKGKVSGALSGGFFVPSL